MYVTKRILIVDDNEVVRHTLRKFLSGDVGVEVCGEAASGRDAIEKAVELKPDLIVMDQRMPISDGLQTAQRMRNLQITAPIILFTMFAENIPAHPRSSYGGALQRFGCHHSGARGVAKSILIVDDSIAVREAVRGLVTDQLGLEVCGEAADGLGALEQLANLCPDLILLDMAMPGMNGLQTARQIRINSVRVPIILFTNYSDAIRPEVVRGAGINAAVSKSNVKELMQQIEILLASGPSRAASA
jgi:CheY-like chemotaxis protein